MACGENATLTLRRVQHVLKHRHMTGWQPRRCTRSSAAATGMARSTVLPVSPLTNFVDTFEHHATRTHTFTAVADTRDGSVMADTSSDMLIQLDDHVEYPMVHKTLTGEITHTVSEFHGLGRRLQCPPQTPTDADHKQRRAARVHTRPFETVSQNTLHVHCPQLGQRHGKDFTPPVTNKDTMQPVVQQQSSARLYVTVVKATMIAND
ncbi:hypothetical protein DFH27DRAFT_616024 [Peziza echinospora]|nr:hypothetical protein DFH27DRAFT_616024 [Peziza echinospora]